MSRQDFDPEDPHQKRTGMLAAHSHGREQRREQLHQPTEQLHPDSIISFSVWLTESEQKGCLVLGAIRIIYLGSSGASHPREPLWCLCSPCPTPWVHT